MKFIVFVMTSFHYSKQSLPRTWINWLWIIITSAYCLCLPCYLILQANNS